MVGDDYEWKERADAQKEFDEAIQSIDRTQKGMWWVVWALVAVHLLLITIRLFK